MENIRWTDVVINEMVLEKIGENIIKCTNVQCRSDHNLNLHNIILYICKTIAYAKFKYF